MMFLDLLLGILLGMFIAAITALVIAITCLLFNELKKKTMSREEAIKALEEGNKVTHKRWHKGDYAVKIFDNYLQFEDGSQCSLAIFKAIYNESWNDNNWEIIKD